MKRVRISAATLERATTDAKTGKTYDVYDVGSAGLSVRVRGGRAHWCLRCRYRDQQRRFDLGAADKVTADEARGRADQVRARCRAGQSPDELIVMWSTGLRPWQQEAKPTPSWTWEHARTQFLDEVFRTRRPATLDDYTKSLQVADLAVLAGRRIADITRADLAGVVAAIHARGAEAQAEHVLRVLKSCWGFLSEDRHAKSSGARDPLLLAKLRAPARTRREVGDPDAVQADDDASGDVPAELELGRALVIARSGALPERTGLGLQLLLGCAQRRRTVVGARVGDFREIEAPAESDCKRTAESDCKLTDELWRIPPYFRKAATKRRSQRPHVVPLVGWVADAARALQRLAPTEGDSAGWLLPAFRARRKGVQPKSPHADVGLFNDALSEMAGVTVTPHGVRRAFASYGGRDLGFRERPAPGEAALVLDHLEGAEPEDVTAAFYALDPQLVRKREMLAAWAAWLDGWAARALDADPTLGDREALDDALKRARDARKGRPATGRRRRAEAAEQSDTR